MSPGPFRIVVACSLLGAGLVTAPPAHATWPHDPIVGLPVCSALGDQQNPFAVTDGVGGTIVVWNDLRGASADIYAQRLSRDGVPLWTADGVIVCSSANAQSVSGVIATGGGGAIVVWIDHRSDASGDVYAQKLDRNGERQWTASGVPVCSVAGGQTSVRAAPDSAGGAIIAWRDLRFGSGDIYAQRVSTQGLLRWTLGGVPVCSATGSQEAPAIVSDGSGGAIVSWQDVRGAVYQIYAQRVSGAGVVQWTAQGVTLAATATNQFTPIVLSDDAGGIIVSWNDSRGGASITDVYAQRVAHDGTMLWGSGGLLLCASTGNQYYAQLARDGAGGAVAVWKDERSGNLDLYAQRVDAGGGLLWGPNGVLVCHSTGEHYITNLLGDGAGGAIAAWGDYRNGTHEDIFAQRMNAAGAMLWTHDGVPISTAAEQQLAPVVVPDGAGGAIAVWQDFREPGTDVYAQRFDRFGKLGDAAPAIARVADVPNDQGGKVQLEWTASYLDTFPNFEIEQYSVWRQVPEPSAAMRASRVQATAESGRRVERDRFMQAGPAGAQAVYWEYLFTLPARGLPGYSVVAATTSDSLPGANPFTSFMVMAEQPGGTPFWMSAADSGYSVDDIAPPMPAPFTGHYLNGGTSLDWGESVAPDLAGYRLHRGDAAGFVPDLANLISAQPATGYNDWYGVPCYYKLCAVDIHGNISPYALLTPEGTVDVPGAALPRELALSAPAPNPLRGSATVTLALPRAVEVRLAVYDQQGRRVRVLVAGGLPAGEHPIVWDGRDEGGRAVSGGIYFVRCVVEGRTFTRRVAALR